MTTRQVGVPRLPAVVVLSIVMLLTSCGDDDGDPDTSGTTSADVTRPAGDEPREDGAGIAQSWSERSPAPVPATEVGAALFDERIWVVGGFDGDGRALDTVQVYDPADDSWSAGPPLPVTVHHAAVVASDDSLLVVGGFAGSGFGEPTDSVWRLLPDAADWTAGPRLPSPRGAGAGAWDGAQVVFGGGAGPDGPSADVWALSQDSWSPVGELEEARDHLGAASDGEGRVWFMGGRFGSLDSNRATVDLVDDGRVRSTRSLPTPRGGAAGFHDPAVGACLVGGEGPDGTFDAVECIDVDGRTTTLAPLGQPRHGIGAAAADGVAYILLGGPEPGLTVSDAVEALAVR